MNNQNFRNIFSRLFGKFTRSKKPYFVVKAFTKWYIKFYKIDITQYNFTLKKGVCFNDFFTRKKNNPPIIKEATITSPADAVISECGLIDNDSTFHVKSKKISFKDLTSEVLDNSKTYSFMIFYLSPADYHRFHSPFNICINELKYFPGTLFPVNDKSVTKRKDVFCRNERFALKGNWKKGEYWYIAVGALNVGQIELNFTTEQSNKKKARFCEQNYPEPFSFKQGNEIGKFSTGSTIILCVDSNLLNKPELLNKKVIVGEALA